MISRSVIVGITLLLLGAIASQANAQLRAEGRALGTSVEVLGTDVSLLRTADTETQSATAKGSFSATATGVSVDGSPLATVVSSSSSTSGSADDAVEKNRSFVSSSAGDVVASVLIGQAPGAVDVLNAATSNTTMTISCSDSDFGTTSGLSGTSSLELLRVGGTPIIANPGTVTPNTVVLVPGVIDLLILNEQRFVAAPDGRGGTFTVNAVDLQAISDGDIAQVLISSASGSLLDIPEETECDLIPPPPFFNSRKLAEVASDEDNNGKADVGDTLRFRLQAENSSAEDQIAVQVIDRLPRELTVDTDSVTVDGDPVEATIGECPAGANFKLCTDEPSVACLTVDIGDVPAGTTREVAFEATIEDEAVNGENEGTDCNTALIGGVERRAITAIGVGFDKPPIIPDILRTTGSGGCAIHRGSGQPSFDFWPVLLLAAGLALRPRLRRQRH